MTANQIHRNVMTMRRMPGRNDDCGVLKRLPLYDEVERYNKLPIIEPAAFYREFKSRPAMRTCSPYEPMDLERRSGRTTRGLIGLIRWCYWVKEAGFYFTHSAAYASSFNRYEIPKLEGALGIRSRVIAYPIFEPITGLRGIYAIDHYVYELNRERPNLKIRDYLELVKIYLSPV